jgi:hypothetical protein
VQIQITVFQENEFELPQTDEYTFNKIQFDSKSQKNDKFKHGGVISFAEEFREKEFVELYEIVVRCCTISSIMKDLSIVLSIFEKKVNITASSHETTRNRLIDHFQCRDAVVVRCRCAQSESSLTCAILLDRVLNNESHEQVQVNVTQGWKSDRIVSRENGLFEVTICSNRGMTAEKIEVNNDDSECKFDEQLVRIWNKKYGLETEKAQVQNLQVNLESPFGMSFSIDGVKSINNLSNLTFIIAYNRKPIATAYNYVINEALHELAVSNPEQFRTKREKKLALVSSEYIPTISTSIQEIIMQSTNKEFRSQALALLKVESIEQVSEKIQVLLHEIYKNKK